MNSTFHLNLHHEFFAQIAAGAKRTEYRSRTPYWHQRLEGRQYDLIQLRNGYAAKAPEMLVYLNAIPEQWQSGTDGATRIVAYIEQLKEHLTGAMTEMARILA
jgi:hypothetical protein